MKRFFFLLPSLALAFPALAEDALLFDFEDESVIQQQWSAEGSGKEIAVVATDKAASGKQSLALRDGDSSLFGAWLSQPIPLPAAAITAGSVTISWRWLYAIAPAQAMRLSVIFVGEGKEKNAQHFTVKGESDDWSSGTFSDQRHDIPIPPGATQVRIKISSATSKSAEGEFYLDDLQIGQ